MTDTYKYKGLRDILIEEIKKKGIKSEAILEAMRKIPRHLFMAKGFEERAYVDNAFPIDANQTISQPYTVAFQTLLLEVEKRDKILEIGTGSGYQTAVLLELGAKVYTIERHKTLFKSSQILLSKLGYKPYSYYGDGYKGLPTYGPFDKIIITAAPTEIPKELLNQLKIGGFMVAPVGESGSQDMVRIQRTDENKFKTEKFGKFSFVPMLSGKE